MRKILMIFVLLSVCACDHYEQDQKAVVEQAKIDAKTVQGNVTHNTMRVADTVRDNVKRTGEKIREWWLTPLPSNAKQPMPTRYCYKVLQDILCYRQQMAGWENKLVGYQGANADPATPAKMKPLALRSDDKNALPDKRAENLKPVFVGAATDPKETKDENASKTADVNIDATHENLPESPLSPQL